MNSLRGQLALFWLILSTVCAALAVVMLVLFRSSAGAQIEAAQATAERACSTVAVRYDKSLADPAQATPQIDLLQVLLQLVLTETPRVEGGVWRSGQGFLAYAYPTYEGSGVKRDIPDAETAHIAEIAQVVARTQLPQSDVVRASREALVVSACPLRSPNKDLVGWTMTRTSLAIVDAQQSLRFGLGALLAFVLASGLWLGSILLRAYRHVRRLEAQLAADDPPGARAALAGTGVKELDRIVGALNLYRRRNDDTLARLREVERQQARDQRLAALGRMTGSVAHEIRNPIAAMRLKAENALAGPPDKHPAALNLILGQIARLDGLVQSLLAVVQPINLALQTIDLGAWLGERLATVRPEADAKGLTLDIRLAPIHAGIDALHLGRAVDNLLDNAVRHARQVVHVSLQRSAGDRVLIRVEDDGSGVAETVRDQLFEPFASDRPDGTGLGLSLAREVALAHGGDLTHVALPQGTRFELDLPWHAC